MMLTSMISGNWSAWCEMQSAFSNQLTTRIAAVRYIMKSKYWSQFSMTILVSFETWELLYKSSINYLDSKQWNKHYLIHADRHWNRFNLTRTVFTSCQSLWLRQITGEFNLVSFQTSIVVRCYYLNRQLYRNLARSSFWWRARIVNLHQ